MSVNLKKSNDRNADFSVITVKDITGIYDPATNPGGYGAPNETIGEVTAAVLRVLYPGAIVEKVIDVYPTLPNITNTGFDITPALLGMSGDVLE